MTIAKTTPRGLTVPVQQLPHAQGLPLPAYQTAGSAGMDLTAAVPEKKPMRLAAGAHALVPTGLAIALPTGYEAQIRPRSGLALKQGITVLNSPGTIDSDYRGEIQVILVNHSRQPVSIRRGDRIAQMVIAPVTQAQLTLAVTLGGTARGAGGFGSTGKVAATSKPARTPAKSPAQSPAKSTRAGAVKKSSKVAPATVRGKAIAGSSARLGRRAR